MQELIHNLGIDWRLLITQIVNFAILLFLLKRFLYTPILKKLDERRAKIEKGLEDAKRAEANLVMAKEEKQHITDAAHREANTILATAREEEQAVVANAREHAEQEVARIRKRTEQELTRERERVNAELQSEAANVVVTAVEKVLREKIDRDEEERLIKRLMRTT